MGKSGKKFVQSVTEDPIGFVSNPTVFLGTKGPKDAVEGYLEGKLPELPAAPVLATEETASEQLADDANLENQITGRRGRASTILSGPQGLSGSTQYSARKTLLGA